MSVSASRKHERKLIESRAKNLRQLLTRATRTLNKLVLNELTRRGHTDVRLAHAALLANLDVEGNTISAVAERASMTKQALGQLAQEMEEKGYLLREADELDARATRLRFTDKGWRLMLDSFKAIDSIEKRYSKILGRQTMRDLRAGLYAFVALPGLGGDGTKKTPRAKI